MSKLAIYYEVDKDGIDTGRVQVVDEDEGLVLGTYPNEPEAEAAMVEIQEEDTRNEKIETEYLEWEKACLERYKITKEELRIYLANYVCV